MLYRTVPKKWERVFRVIESISYISMIISVMCVLALVVLIIASSLGRYIFHRPILNSDEMAGYLLLSLVLFGLAYTLGQQRHIKVDFVVRYFKKEARSVIDLVLSVIGLIWTISFLIGSWLVWLYYINNHTTSSMGTGVLLAIPSVMLIIGSSVLILQHLVEICKRFFLVFNIKSELNLEPDVDKNTNMTV